MILTAITSTNAGVLNEMHYHLQEMESMIQYMESYILKELDSPIEYEYDETPTTNYIEVREPTVAFLSSIPINLSTTTPIEQDVVVGLNAEGEYLYFRDLEDAHFFMTFPIQGGYVWFFGGLNEQGQWHGNAIQNDFNMQGKLLALLEGQFYNGQLVGAYRQITREANRNNERQFRVHHCYVHDGFTEGETFVYRYMDFPEERFMTETPIRFDDVAKHSLSEYYRGRISGNRFNDVTGNAIYIDFTEDGYIRLFYIGHFVGGSLADQRPFDETNIVDSALSIVLHGQQYHINIGRFSDNSFNWDSSDYTRAVLATENPTNLLPPGLNICETLLRWKTWGTDNI